MIAVFWIAVFAALLLTLAYRRAGCRSAAITIGLLLTAHTLTAAGWLAALLPWLFFVGALYVFTHTAARRALLVRPAFHTIRRRLPAISPAARTQLDAGTSGWEAQLFSGAPFWRRLERMPETELDDNERAFIEGPLHRLTRLCDATHSPGSQANQEIQRFIEDHGLQWLAMPEHCGAPGFSAYGLSCARAQLASHPATATRIARIVEDEPVSVGHWPKQDDVANGAGEQDGAARALGTTAQAAGEAVHYARRASLASHAERHALADTQRAKDQQAALASIAGRTYALEALRRFSANAIDLGEKPATMAPIVEYWASQALREIRRATHELGATEAADTRGAATTGNPASAPAPSPALRDAKATAFAQALVACHPVLRTEIDTANRAEHGAAIAAFEPLIGTHVRHVLAAAAKSLVMGVTGGAGTATGHNNRLAPYYRRVNRYTANLALLAEAVCSSANDRRGESAPVVARPMADILATLYTVCAVLKRYLEDEQSAGALACVDWVCRDAFATLEDRLAQAIRYCPGRVQRWVLRALVFPAGRRARPPADAQHARLARIMRIPGCRRERLLSY